MENKGILIIGGTGYVGKALLKKLADEKIKVSCLVRKESGEIDSYNFEQIKGDILDKNSLIKATKNKKLIVYLAALKKGSRKRCWKINVRGLKNTLEAMRLNKVKKIIYFSTKNADLKKRDNYAETKRIGEEILKKLGINFVILKPDFIYGIDRNNFFSKLIKIVLKYRIFPIFGKGNKFFYPVDKDFVSEICVKFIKRFKIGVYGISGEEVSFNGLSDYLKSLKLNFLTVHFPLFFGGIFEAFLPFSLSVFRENRTFSEKDFISKKSLKKQLQKIIKII